MSKLEKLLYTGKEAKSYGQLGEVKKTLFRMVYSVFLGEKFNKKRLIIRTKTTSLLNFQFQYVYLDKEAVKKLKEICDDALKKM